MTQDVAHQAGVLETVLAKTAAVLSKGLHDALRHALIRARLHGLAPADDTARHGAQAIIIEALRGGTDQVQGVEDLAAVDDHAAGAPDLTLSVPGGIVAAAEIERHAQCPAAALQDRQIEIDQVPSTEDIRVDGTNASGGGFEQQAFVGMTVQGRRVVVGRFTDDVNLGNLID